MQKSYSLKTIRTSITLGQGTFGGGGNTKIIEGLATDVEVTKPGLPEKNSASVTITNMGLSDMEQMTFLAFQPQQSLKNLITIEAGEQGRTLDVVFKGEITSAYSDFSGAPDIRFKIEAISGGYAAQIGAKPVSVNGEALAADLIKQFAAEIGYSFRNEGGVTASVRNATFNGSPIEKAKSVADEVGAELLIDDDAMILMSYDKPRGEPVPLSPETGLIGYPSFTSDGISCTCFYDPNFKQGGVIELKSIVPRATGRWKIVKLTHNLSAYVTGGGKWQTDIDAAYIGGGANG